MCKEYRISKVDCCKGKVGDQGESEHTTRVKINNTKVN